MTDDREQPKRQFWHSVWVREDPHVERTTVDEWKRQQRYWRWQTIGYMALFCIAYPVIHVLRMWELLKEAKPHKRCD